jgi:hypothetical protein
MFVTYFKAYCMIFLEEARGKLLQTSVRINGSPYVWNRRQARYTILLIQTEVM